jgi:hypothetical protein
MGQIRRGAKTLGGCRGSVNLRIAVIKPRGGLAPCPGANLSNSPVRAGFVADGRSSAFYYFRAEPRVVRKVVRTKELRISLSVGSPADQGRAARRAV